MKLPPKNSRMEKILTALRGSGPITMEQGIARHGRFLVTLDALADFYATLVLHGCLTRDGQRYALSAAAVAHFRGPDEAAAPAPLLVPPRVSNVFSAPLHARYQISALGTREGSNAWRDIPSLYAPLGH